MPSEWRLLRRCLPFPAASSLACRADCQTASLALADGWPTHTAFGTDLAKRAQASGCEPVSMVETQEAFELVLDRAMQHPGPWIMVALLDNKRAAGRPPKSPTYITHRFMDSLGSHKV